jgi:hypothetical protein
VRRTAFAPVKVATGAAEAGLACAGLSKGNLASLKNYAEFERTTPMSLIIFNGAF